MKLFSAFIVFSSFVVSAYSSCNVGTDTPEFPVTEPPATRDPSCPPCTNVPEPVTIAFINERIISTVPNSFPPVNITSSPDGCFFVTWCTFNRNRTTYESMPFLVSQSITDPTVTNIVLNDDVRLSCNPATLKWATSGEEVIGTGCYGIPK